MLCRTSGEFHTKKRCIYYIYDANSVKKFTNVKHVRGKDLSVLPNLLARTSCPILDEEYGHLLPTNFSTRTAVVFIIAHSNWEHMVNQIYYSSPS